VSVREHTFSAQSNSRRALALFNCLREGRLRIPRDDALLEELRSVRLLERAPGQYRVDHDAGRHDDRVTVLGLLAVELAAQPAGVAATGCYLCGQQNVADGHVCDDRGPVRRVGDLVLVGEKYRDRTPAELGAAVLGGAR
jgi:hypothetical protein